MHRAIIGERTPNLFLLHYVRPQLRVESVVLIPHFAFSLSCLERRKALSKTARRSGYIGCYFALDRIPPDARIPVVHAGIPTPPHEVRSAYARVRPLEELAIEKRGWTLDVLNVVRSLGKQEFQLSDVYAHSDELARLHPDNRHVNPKIRQQLQVLRDLRLLEFLTPGHYRLP